MLDKPFPSANAPRNPIPIMVQLLKGCRGKEVRLLVARHLATNVFNGDCDGVFYWCIVYHGVFGGKISSEMWNVLNNLIKQSSNNIST